MNMTMMVTSTKKAPQLKLNDGSGPAAAAYADRVLADAHAHQGQGSAMSVSLGYVGASGGYINPFAGKAWAPSLNDQGVDYDPLKVEPVRAIGALAVGA